MARTWRCHHQELQKEHAAPLVPVGPCRALRCEGEGSNGISFSTGGLQGILYGG